MKYLSLLIGLTSKCSRTPGQIFPDSPLLHHRTSTHAYPIWKRGQSHRSKRSTTTNQKMRPLDGVTVVSLEQAIAAPYCTRQLADMGARVIKVERRGEGDFARAYDTRVHGLSSHFIWTNRSKESLTLDLKQPQDSKILSTLLGRADVFVQNLAPGAASRLGLSYNQLHNTHRGLIVCDISGYGQTAGPYTHKKAYDLLVQSEAGVLSVTGTPAGPAKAGLPIADIAAGSFAYSNILAALIQRDKSGQGEGCHIDVSMLESMVEWMGFPMYYAFDGQAPPVRAGASHPTVYPYGPFGTGVDKGSVMLGLQNEREWGKFCDSVLHRPELVGDERFRSNALRSENRTELKKIIEDVFGDLTAGQVLERLDAAGIASASVNDMQAVWAHPQLKARRRWAEVGTEAGVVPALLPPGVLGGVDEAGDGLRVRMDEVPRVGQHNEKILAELGLTEHV